jgi:hypothetical protein
MGLKYVKICLCKLCNRNFEFEFEKHQIKEKCCVNHMTLDTKGSFI